MNSKAPPFKILFLCTGNSARSILAEFLTNRIIPRRFEAHSAGSKPKAGPDPLALRVLREQYNIDVSSARSKSWDEFKGIHFDFVITLCDDAKETCPVWPGQPILAHWPSVDPSATEGTDEERLQAFWQVSRQINRRLELFSSLPFEKLDAIRLRAAVEDIGNH